MNRHVLLAIFIRVVTIPVIIGDSSCILSNNEHHRTAQEQNYVLPPSTTPLTKSSVVEKESEEDIEVNAGKSRIYEKGSNGRRDRMGTPIRPDGPGGPKREVPTDPTTASIDLKAPKNSSARTIDPKYSRVKTTMKRRIRTPPPREAFAETCDYLAHYCLKAYNTGKLCARTLYYTYYTYQNFCMMDYVNCMERFEIWQIVHMGPCFNITELTEYMRKYKLLTTDHDFPLHEDSTGKWKLGYYPPDVIFPYTTADTLCKLSNGDNQDVTVQNANSTSPSSTTLLTTKLMDRNDSPEDIEVITRKNRLYEKGRNRRNEGRMGTPIRPDGPGGSRREVPTDPTTVSGQADAKIPGAKTMRVDPRYTVPTTTRRRRIRTTPERISLQENCDYLAYYCLKAYNTGRLCARTLYYSYYTFKNYCMMDYVNCMEGYEIWQIVHMGPCFNIRELTEYNYYPYQDALFLEKDYVVDIL